MNSSYGTPPADRGEAWLEAVFRQCHRAVLAYAVRRVPDEADDVVAEVFTTAWRHRDRVPDEPLPWLYRTASHQILHVRRGRARRTRLDARLTALPHRHEVADHGDLVDGRLDAETGAARVFAALSPTDGEVLRLWAWEELDSAAIAYVLGCTPTAARVRLHRAKRRAQAALGTSNDRATTLRVLEDLR